VLAPHTQPVTVGMLIEPAGDHDGFARRFVEDHDTERVCFAHAIESWRSPGGMAGRVDGLVA
jgi:hypothetical protein